MASPMYLSTVPPCRNTASVITVRYSRRNSTTSSGASRSDRVVKPRMSEKSTVRRRRPDCSESPASWLRTISRTTAGEKKRESRRFSRCSLRKLCIAGRAVADREGEGHRDRRHPEPASQEGDVGEAEIGHAGADDRRRRPRGAASGSRPRRQRAPASTVSASEVPRGRGSMGSRGAESPGHSRGSRRRASCRWVRRASEEVVQHGEVAPTSTILPAKVSGGPRPA